jgi:hypothetical protein
MYIGNFTWSFSVIFIRCYNFGILLGIYEKWATKKEDRNILEK